MVRKDGPQTHLSKAGTPTMGGVMILLAVAVSTLLWADLANRYVWLVLAVLLCFGAIGFYDDYRKLVLKDSRGLASRWKYFWQSVFGLGAAWFLYHTRRAFRRRRRCSCRCSSMWRCRWACSSS